MPGQSGSHMDQRFCSDISRIADALTILATCAQAEEKRRERLETGGWGPVKDEMKPGFEGAALAGAVNTPGEYEAWRADNYLEGECSQEGCSNPVVAMIDYKRYCQDHIEVGFSQIGAAIKAAKAGFQYLEDAIQGITEVPDKVFGVDPKEGS